MAKTGREVIMAEEYNREAPERIKELEEKLAIAYDTLCHLENATDAYSVQRHDAWNLLINDAIKKIK